jgi:hypothetical protein
MAVKDRPGKGGGRLYIEDKENRDLAISRAAGEGRSDADIAAAFGLSEGYVCDIRLAHGIRRSQRHDTDTGCERRSRFDKPVQRRCHCGTVFAAANIAETWCGPCRMSFVARTLPTTET